MLNTMFPALFLCRRVKLTTTVSRRLICVSERLFVLFQYLDMLKTNQKHPLRCLSIMWALGQAGTHNLAAGLRGEYINRNIHSAVCLSCGPSVRQAHII